MEFGTRQARGHSPGVQIGDVEELVTKGNRDHILLKLRDLRGMRKNCVLNEL